MVPRARRMIARMRRGRVWVLVFMARIRGGLERRRLHHPISSVLPPQLGLRTLTGRWIFYCTIQIFLVIFFCNWCKAERQSEVRHLTSVNHLTSATLKTLNSSKLCFERKVQKLMIVLNILSFRIQQGELRVWDDGVKLSVHKLHKTNILITHWH